jgi:hypothetical protein
LTFERLECDELTSPIIDLREQMLKLKDWVFSFFVIAVLTGGGNILLRNSELAVTGSQPTGCQA